MEHGLDVYKRQVDDRGLFIGIITRKDIIKYYYEKGNAAENAAEVKSGLRRAGVLC